MPLFEVQNLQTQLFTPRGVVNAVNGVDFRLEKGEILALVGESGSGKSITAMSIMGLLSKQKSQVTAEKILINQMELTQMSEREYNQIRGREISMIFQNPLTALDPSYKIGKQIVEVIVFRKNVSKIEAVQEAKHWLDSVGIKDVERVMDSYPHELSGGMRQRVVIAMSISCQPKIIIADEPTTALDATIQKQILSLLKKVNREQNISIIIITHDFGVVANLSDHVAVMYAGKIIEYGETKNVLNNPMHPYTQGLIGAVPLLGKRRAGHRLTQIEGSPPDLIHLPRGCSFADRCKEVTKHCFEQLPNRTEIKPGHFVNCFKREEIRRDNTG